MVLVSVLAVAGMTAYVLLQNFAPGVSALPEATANYRTSTFGIFVANEPTIESSLYCHSKDIWIKDGCVTDKNTLFELANILNRTLLFNSINGIKFIESECAANGCSFQQSPITSVRVFRDVFHKLSGQSGALGIYDTSHTQPPLPNQDKKKNSGRGVSCHFARGNSAIALNQFDFIIAPQLTECQLEKVSSGVENAFRCLMKHTAKPCPFIGDGSIALVYLDIETREIRLYPLKVRQ